MGAPIQADEQRLKHSRILAVDDERSNLLLLGRILERDGYTRVDVTADPSRVVGMFVETRPDLVLLDLHMPGIDGFELMARLGPLTGGGRDVPVLVLTADATDETKRRALSAGARDFLTKPLDQIELLLRVRNLLDVKQLQDRLRDHNAHLEEQVAERTRDLDHARLEMLAHLALAGEFRDDATQQHAWRIGGICALLVLALGLSEQDAELIERAAPLHDLGKIGISRIALTHHERWDGGGYPSGLCGDAIPLVGRVAAVADVFDALTHKRPYKPAWSVDAAVTEIVGQAGRQFDPRVIDAFCTLDHVKLLRPVRPPETLCDVEHSRLDALCSTHA